MNENRERRTRRSTLVQRAVVGGGVVSALGVALGVGAQIHPSGATAPTHDTRTTWQPPPHDQQTRKARTTRDSRPTRRTRRTPVAAPQPGSTSSSHGTSSGS